MRAGARWLGLKRKVHFVRDVANGIDGVDGALAVLVDQHAASGAVSVEYRACCPPFGAPQPTRVPKSNKPRTPLLVQLDPHVLEPHVCGVRLSPRWGLPARCPEE